MIADECSTYNLKHGVKLTIRNTSGQLNITSVAHFLVTAIQHFKQLRDNPAESSLSEGPFGGEIIEGQTSLGEIRLSSCHYTTLPASLWTDSVIDAFSRTNTLEQIRDDLPAWQKQISRDGRTPGFQEQQSVIRHRKICCRIQAFKHDSAIRCGTKEQFNNCLISCRRLISLSHPGIQPRNFKGSYFLEERDQFFGNATLCRISTALQLDAFFGCDSAIFARKDVFVVMQPCSRHRECLPILRQRFAVHLAIVAEKIEKQSKDQDCPTSVIWRCIHIAPVDMSMSGGIVHSYRGDLQQSLIFVVLLHEERRAFPSGSTEL